MIAFGVAPGIKSLAYCAVEWSDGRLDVLDEDTLTKPKRLFRTPQIAAQLYQRFHCHHLILTTVWGRYTPAVIVVGPAADPQEPSSYVFVARAILREAGALMGVPVLDVDQAKLEDSFGVNEKRSLRSALGRVFIALPRDNRGLIAAAAAAYGIVIGDVRSSENLFR